MSGDDFSRRCDLCKLQVFIDDIENYFAAVDGAGWPVLSPLTTRPWGLTDFRLADPDGYYLRLTSRPED